MKKLIVLALSLVLSCAHAKSVTEIKAVAQVPSDSESLQSVAPSTVMYEVSSFEEDEIAALIAKIQESDKNGDTIYLRDNTNGGSVMGLMSLAQALEQTKNPVTCVVDWRAFSAGAFLLEQPGCRTRLMSRRSSLLFHEALSQSQGNEHAMKDTMNEMHAITRSLVVSCADRMGMKEADFWKHIDNQVWMLNYDEALKFHAIDGIADLSKLPPLTPIVVEHKSLLDLLGLGK